MEFFKKFPDTIVVAPEGWVDLPLLELPTFAASDIAEKDEIVFEERLLVDFHFELIVPVFLIPPPRDGKFS